LKGFYRFLFFLWLAASIVSMIFASVMFSYNNTTKAGYLLAVTFFSGLMAMINNRRIKNIKE